MEDLKGTAHGLTRLIEMYHLNVRDLADGKFNGEALRYNSYNSTTDKILPSNNNAMRHPCYDNMAVSRGVIPWPYGKCSLLFVD